MLRGKKPNKNTTTPYKVMSRYILDARLKN
jgi:hypothetical protein